ncbi:MAG: hypothetical protein GX060_08765 [Firmicutes bacterium]|nr:hypothetical protein [Bacillota bacterium]
MGKLFNYKSLRNRMTLTVLILLTVAIVVTTLSLSTSVKNTIANIVRDSATQGAQAIANQLASQLDTYRQQLATAWTMSGANGPSANSLQRLVANTPQAEGAWVRLGSNIRRVGTPWLELENLPLTDLTAGISNPVLGPNDNWLLPVWHSIFDTDGEVIGLVGLMLDLHPLIDQLAALGGEIMVLNQQGEAVLGSTASMLMQGDARIGTKHSAITDAARGALAQQAGAIAFALSGEQQIIAYAPVQNTSWGLIHQLPYK